MPHVLMKTERYFEELSRISNEKTDNTINKTTFKLARLAILSKLVGEKGVFIFNEDTLKEMVETLAKEISIELNDEELDFISVLNMISRMNLVVKEIQTKVTLTFSSHQDGNYVSLSLPDPINERLDLNDGGLSLDEVKILRNNFGVQYVQYGTLYQISVDPFNEREAVENTAKDFLKIYLDGLKKKYLTV